MQSVGAADRPDLEIINGMRVIPGRILVTLDPAMRNQATTALVAKQFALKMRFRIVDAEVWTLPAGVSVADALALVKQCPGIVAAWPATVVEPDDLATPNDTYYREQYGLKLMEFPEAWACGEIPEIIVGVVDSGVAVDHPDLAGNIFINAQEIPGDAIDNDGNGYVDDVNGWDFGDGDNDVSDATGHGTEVAGVIGAVTNNDGLGIAGGVPNVRILPLKIYETRGVYARDKVIEACEYAIDCGAKVLNLSYSDPRYSNFELQGLRAAQEEGLFIITSAGNVHGDNDVREIARFPCSYNLSNVISVMATDAQDNKADFSNYGAASVDIAASGKGIKTTTRPSGYAAVDGTSFSAPHVAAIVAMLMARNPTVSLDGVRQMLLEGADPQGSLCGKCATQGRANAYRALCSQVPDTLVASDTPSPPTQIPDTGSWVTRTITISENVLIRSVSVTVTMQHQNMNELEIKLTSPLAKESMLLTRPYFIMPEENTSWPASEPFTFQTRWDLRGDTAAGIWTLGIRDFAGNEKTGQLEYWSIVIQTYDDGDSCKQGGGCLFTGGSTAEISNCILWANVAPSGRGSEIAIASTEDPSEVTVTYSDVEDGEPGVAIEDQCTLTWGDDEHGDTNLDADPLFYDAVNRDYHEKSLHGRWDPSQSQWAIDQVHSPCIDRGDPERLFANEPQPAGFAINIGAFGDTVEASKGEFEARIPGDANGDCSVNVLDLYFVRNRLLFPVSSGDNWKADVNNDNSINILDLLFVRNRLNQSCP